MALVVAQSTQHVSNSGAEARSQKSTLVRNQRNLEKNFGLVVILAISISDDTKNKCLPFQSLSLAQFNEELQTCKMIDKYVNLTKIENLVF